MTIKNILVTVALAIVAHLVIKKLENKGII